MRDLSQAKFYISYYEAAQKLQSDADRHLFYDVMLDYIFGEKEPPADLPFAVDLLFTTIKPFIDADIKRKQGGAPEGNNNAQKQPKKTTSKQPQKQLVDLDVETTSENNLKTKTKTNNVNVNVNVNDNENENDKEVVSSLSPSQTEYSKKLFNLMKGADLPCCRGNEISFMMQDFSNSLSYLKNTPEYSHLHSDDLIGAVQNYIEVLQDPDSYLTQKFSLYTLVTSKLFYKLLPQNYVKSNFKKFGKSAEQEKPKIKEFFYSQPCPKCNQKKLVWINDRQKYECRNCNAVIMPDEVEDAGLSAMEDEEWDQ